MSRKGFREMDAADGLPRMVGERTKPIELKRKKIYRGGYPCTCQHCKKDKMVPAQTIHKWFGGDPSRYVCYPCKGESERLVKEAALAVFRRRVEQKRKKEEAKEIEKLAAKLDRKIAKLRANDAK